MRTLVVLLFLTVAISCTKGLVAPIAAKVEQEHKVFVRSTPSLDPTEELLEKFGSDLKMNESNMEALFKSVGLEVLNQKDDTGKSSEAQKCFTSEYFFGMYSRNDGNINKTDLMELCPAVLYQLTKEQCHGKVKDVNENKEEEPEEKENPTRAWGFGFLFVTIISFGSLIGAFVVPLMNKSFYKKTLMCMVSLAVGVLGGSGIFHLIPHAFGLPFEDNDKSHLWKSCMIFAGLYVFLVLECAMKLYIRFKNMKSDKNEKHEVVWSEVEKVVPPELSELSKKVSESDLMDETTSSEQIVSQVSEKPVIATVAWMIIVGDGLHNFIDGLAIGASFSGSVIIGISTSLAVICEELPHELGDFAILLNSGMSYKQAMLANFLSACCCYIGLVIGLVLGYKTRAVKYIYGIAGGMFIYISLVDMLPEALEMAYSLSENSRSKSIKLLCLVNFAIVFGFCIMLVIALYGNAIKL